MKVHEYQAKKLLAQYGIPVPKGDVATTPEQARDIAASLGGKVAVKAQILAGGRGKGGGIKLAGSPAEAQQVAAAMLGKPLITPQTSPQGVIVKRVLVEEATDIARELYLGAVVDRARRQPVVMASEAGGMEIEEVAARSPEKILRAHVDMTIGFQPFLGKILAYGINLPADQIRPGGALIANLYKLFADKDCSLAEINPLVVTGEGKLVALDAKLNFDDNALFRHRDLEALREFEEETPLEIEADRVGASYVQLSGSVGCLVNGAGLAMATMDMAKSVGIEPANFLDVGGGASSERVTSAFKILLADPNVKIVLLNIFGGILRCDVAAQGILDAAKEVEVKVPIVVRMRGTNVDEGKKMMVESGLNVTMAADLGDAAQKLAALARG